MNEKEFQTRYIKARRAVIERDFAALNDMQREAVMTTDGPLLLLAGAGSGKTTVLINRIANLLRYGRASDSDELPEGVSEKHLEILEAAAENPSYEGVGEARHLSALDPCEPWRIIAITFTNKAASELKARLQSMLGSAADDIWAQTFHSACVRILRKYADRLGYSSSFTIYDTSDSQSVMKHILKDLDIDDKTFPHKTVLGYISKAKDSLLDANTFYAQAKASGDIRRQKIGEAYVAYEKRLKDADAMDFDDLIYNTVRVLESCDDAREYYQRRFKYVLIDEYQDTNNLQYRLASALAGGYENICVVGDDDQSIYKFRGATIENILSFETQYKNARVIRLEQNYRSTGNILGAANAVISNNRERKGKELWTEKPGGEKLTLYVAQNENDEAQFVASRMLESFALGINWRENAILYRMNAQSNKLEYALKRNGIPYRVVGGMRFFDRAEVKDMLAYLCVLQMPQDDLRLERIINTPARGIGERTIEAARDIAASLGVPLYEVIQNAQNYPELSRASVKLREFTIMLDELRAQAETLPLDELYELVVEKTGYVKALEAKMSDENRARIENVGELKSNIISYMKDTGDTGLAGFLDEVALYTDMDSFDASSDCAVMMTMHSAKGLEFDNVFLVGAEEGIFPGLRCMGEPEEMEEERRLCYVGLTRARKKLTLCCARQRMLFGHTTANSPSRFIDEIPDEYLERIEARRSDDFGAGVPTRRYGESAVPGGARGSAYGSEPGEYSSAQDRGYGSAPRRAAYEPKPKRTLSSAPTPAPMVAFKTGDSVCHKAFGDGVITKMTPMGGDYLVEIRFGDTEKRLMLRAAAQHMSKA